MKFKIRHADKIVGLFVVISLASLVFVSVMLGRSHRWFSKDVSFSTVLPSAGGLSKNMAVQYRGFTIGNVGSFYLTENDDVEVVFEIHEEYRDRVRNGSLVEMMISPVGLGNQFLFHAGKGEELPEGSHIPVVGSTEARMLIRQGIAEDPRHDDSITLLMNRASTSLEELNSILGLVEEAFGEGTTETEIGRIAGSIRKIIADAEPLPGTVDSSINEVTALVSDAVKMIEGLTSRLDPILANVNAVTTELSDPDGLLYAVLDTEGEVYTSLVESLNSVSAILASLDRTMSFVPSQLPQLAGLLMDLRVTMKTAEDVLVALTNNPLLRGGIPERIESRPGGTSPRDIRF